MKATLHHRCARASHALLAVLIGLTFTGCVSSRYKLAPQSTPPAVAFNIGATHSAVEALVNTVIVYQGPGSWKREAYWDEYVLTLANRGAAPLVVDSFSLTGLSGRDVAPGADPWALEKQSRTLEQEGFGLAKDAAVQIGGGVATVAAGAAAGAGTFTLIYGSGWGAGAAGAAIVGAVALPAFIGGSIYANISRRHEIEREFQRRRLALPATLVAGQVAQGSVFFPITPGPRQLVLHCREGRDTRDVVIDLAPITTLHLKARSPQEPAKTVATSQPE
jgi:hypothetical protein